MKEHRTKALRVTTPHSISSDDSNEIDVNSKGNLLNEVSCDNADTRNLFLQVLQVEIHNSTPPSSSSSSSDCSPSTTPSSCSSAASGIFTATAVGFDLAAAGKHEDFNNYTIDDDDSDHRTFNLDYNSDQHISESVPVPVNISPPPEGTDNSDVEDNSDVIHSTTESRSIETMTTDTATITANRTPLSTASNLPPPAYHHTHHHQLVISTSCSSLPSCSSSIISSENEDGCTSSTVNLIPCKSVHCNADDNHTEENESNFSCQTEQSNSLDNNNGNLTDLSRAIKLPTVLEIVSGNLLENWLFNLREIRETIENEKSSVALGLKATTDWSEERDQYGNTALLVSGQKLLRQNAFEKAAEMARILLNEGSDVNAVNNDNRNLLSYSIQHMDDAIQLTILLLNYGINIWPSVRDESIPSGDEGCAENDNRTLRVLISDMDSNINNGRGISNCVISSQNNNNNDNNNSVFSAFTWFLRGVIRHRKLDDHCVKTLNVLSEAMGDDPFRMHSHVLTTMFAHARYYAILGPIFLQIKLKMSYHWKQPHSLKYLCRGAIRRCILGQSSPSSSMSRGRYINERIMSQLPLPQPLQSYIMFQS